MDDTGYGAADDMGSLGALEDPLRRRLYDFVSEQDEPVSRDQASAAAGIGRTLAAYHLDKLESAGLLTVDYQRPKGRRRGPGAGRPAKLYTRADREFSVTLPPRDYELLTRLLLESAEHDTTGEVRAAAGRAAERMGRETGQNARSRSAEADPTSVLTTALRGCGYQPSVEPDGDIALRNCPFDRAARAHREIVCGLNLRLLHGLLEGAGDDPDRAALEPRPGYCCVVIHPGG